MTTRELEYHPFPLAAAVTIAFILVSLVLSLSGGWFSSEVTPSVLTASTARTTGSTIGNAIRTGLSTRNSKDMNKPEFYKFQLVDHFSNDETKQQQRSKTFTNRYYESTEYFGGPGYPILLVVGGEDGLDHGMLYPFVYDDLARALKASVLQIEHRFYGMSQPVDPAKRTIDDLKKLLTPGQAVMDMIQLTDHVRFKEYGCSPDRSSVDKYCPVITIGVSYPGFLSVLFRVLHPDFCDIAYASSAPLLMYAQLSSQYAYYDVVTASADRQTPGCSDAVRATLHAMERTVHEDDTKTTAIASASASAAASSSLTEAAAQRIGVCPYSISNDIQTKEDLVDYINYLFRMAFSDYNMDGYPPRKDNPLYGACRVFTDDQLNGTDTLRSFFYFIKRREEERAMGCDMASVHCDEDEARNELMIQPPSDFCLDLSEEDQQEQANDEVMWNYQTCTDVAFVAGTSNASMFLPFHDEYRQQGKDCQDMFGPGVTPRPYELVREYDYIRRLKSSNETGYVLLTSGKQDIWYPAGISWNLSRTVVALTFDNGAHHSELSHQGPSDQDTDDIRHGYQQIKSILRAWLKEQREQRQRAATTISTS